MRTRLFAVVFGLAIAVLGISALTVASVVSDAEPRQATLTAASSDDEPGDISGPCDEAEHANDPRCVAAPPAPPGAAPTAPAPGSVTRSGNHVLDAGGAGTVTYTVRDGGLTLVEAAPAAGWNVEVEQAAGVEIEVDFRAGTQRVQVNVEIEDGQVRERVRVRDDADDSETRFENGIVVRQDLGDDRDDADDHVDDRDDDFDDRDDNSGPGSFTSGPSHDDEDDRSGHGDGDDDDDHSDSGGDDDDHEDDDDRSGPGGGDDD